MGFIYKITNKINGKVYIGQTITPIKNRRKKIKNTPPKNSYYIKEKIIWVLYIK